MIDLPALYAECAPQIHATTIAAVVQVESRGQVLAINVNGIKTRVPPARTLDEAVAVAEAWIGRGYSVDLGLGQINSKNLARLNLSVRQVFDPCTNLRAAALILYESYHRAVLALGEGQAALMAALSAYNTGTFDRGATNGYLARYGLVPALSVQNTQVFESQGRFVRLSAITPVIARPVARPTSPHTADTGVAWGPGAEEDFR